MTVYLLVKVEWVVDADREVWLNDGGFTKEECERELLTPLAIYLEADKEQADKDLSDLIDSRENWFTWRLIEFNPAPYSVPLVPKEN